MDLNNVLTIQEAVEEVGISTQTLYTWINEGVLAYRQVGSTKVFDPKALAFASKTMAERKFNGERRRGKLKKVQEKSKK